MRHAAMRQMACRSSLRLIVGIFACYPGTRAAFDFTVPR